MVITGKDDGFEGMDEDKDLWGGQDASDAAGASIFYDDFPLPLPDFPCMSSCSSSVVKGNFAYMDLIDTTEIWEPSSVFQTENPQEDQQKPEAAEDDEEDEDGFSFLQGNSELAAIFLDWLKQNRDYISAEDMRNIKLKRSTIESASKRLGSTNEGKKQLLKLILEWIEQKKRLSDPDPPNPNPSFLPNPTTAWMPSLADVATAAFPPPAPMYNGGDPYPTHHHGIPFAQPWPISAAAYPRFTPFPQPQSISAAAYPQFSPFPQPPTQQAASAVYGSPYPIFDPDGRSGSSANKEARKKRMARLYHHRHGSSSSTNSNQLQNHEMTDPHLLGDGDAAADDDDTAAADNWSPGASYDDHRQGWKTEKNLKFLLQKVLKQSDVGNLGRIVLPKKEAESHLPELESSDGISISMEDIETSRVWNMRYRFWPNNKSRMYLLENTGDFVRANGLQEGDLIVIYSDTKCGKYMIRGVKVRQSGLKLEGKKPARRNIRSLLSFAGNSLRS